MAEAQSLVNPDAPAPDEESPPKRPDYIPEHYWDPEAGEAKIKDMAKALADSQTAARAKEEDLRKKIVEEMHSSLPSSSESYTVPEVPLPQGVTRDMLEKDPLVDMARKWAHDAKVPQEAFGKLVTQFVSKQIEALPDPVAERAKLGENADERIARLDHLARGTLSESELTAFRQYLTSAERVEMLEKVIGASKANNGGDFDVGSGTVDSLRARAAAIQEDPRYYKQHDQGLNQELLKIMERLRSVG